MRFRKRGRWEFVERINTTGVAVIIPVTDTGEIILLDQHREPVQSRVIELPAGLLGDYDAVRDESAIDGARRELIEETGYDAAQMKHLFRGPASPGILNEMPDFFLATGLKRVGDGGGDDSEDIEVHAVALDDATPWLHAMQTAGRVIDPKVYMGLYFAERWWAKQ